MARQPTYDFEALKLEFMGSDYNNVKDFFKQRKGIKMNTYVKLQTTGWADEKTRLKRQALSEVRNDTIDAIKERWKEVYRNMEIAQQEGIDYLALLLQKKKVNAKEVIEILKYFRLEKGEGTENISEIQIKFDLGQ